MAVVPKTYATGIVNNNSEYSPEVNDNVPKTNHTKISNVPLAYSSTIEFKGYYKATQTGSHLFSLTSQSPGVTGYSWVSSAPRNSDRIKGNKGEQATKTTRNECFGILISPKRDPNDYWPWEDENFLGTAFPGYGYWPARGYGNLNAFKSQFRSAQSVLTGENEKPDTRVCGDANGYPYDDTQFNIDHQWLIPGDIRRWDNNYFYGPQGNIPNYGRAGGPGWQGPEDPNFANPVWLANPDGNGCPDSDSDVGISPLVSFKNINKPELNWTKNATPNTPGKLSQIFLGKANSAEGEDNYANFYSIDVPCVDDAGEPKANCSYEFVWPQSVGLYTKQNGYSGIKCQRTRIQFSIQFLQEEDTYTFEWRTRDGLKMWYIQYPREPDLPLPGSNYLLKFEPNIQGTNPCNLDSTNTTDRGWRPGGGTEQLDNEGDKVTGFDGSLTVKKNGTVSFWGYAVGREFDDSGAEINEHGFSLVVKNSKGEIVWTTRELLENNRDLIGIDECGYNALLETAEDRINEYRDSESYSIDGWVGYGVNDTFNADILNGDFDVRDVSDTRQYMISNSLTRCRGGESISGSVYLRQGDYYFIRTIVSNHLNENAGYQFQVKSPGGSLRDVQFSGNGDGTLDTVVGGDAGSGIPVRTDILCESVLGLSGAAAEDINFAFIPRLNVVINLTAMGVTNSQLANDIQAEYLDGNVVVPGTDPDGVGGGAPGVYFAKGVEDLEVGVSFVRLLRGGSEGIKDLTLKQRQAVLWQYTQQLQPTIDDENNEGPPLTMPFNQFRNTITSGAVIKWGSGGNYDYLYHGVGRVILAICEGEEIIAPTPPAYDATSDTFNKCIDIDFTNLGEGFSQIASECLDDCKTPGEFPVPTYSINNSDYAGFVDAWRPMIKLKNDYGWDRKYTDINPSGDPVPAVSIIGGSSGSSLAGGAAGGAAYFRPGEITVVPLFIPDVFYDDTLNWTGPIKETTDQKYGDVYCGEIGIDFSSNHFIWNPDDSTEAGSPWMVVWISAFPGGPPLANPNGSGFQSRGFHVYKAQAGTKAYSQIWYTAIYERWEASQDSDSQWYKRYSGYLGNMYGARYLNLVSMKEELKDTYNFVIPDVGTQAFIDLMSEKGGKTNELRTKGVMPVLDCNTTASDSQDGGDYDDPGVTTYDDKYEWRGNYKPPNASNL